MFALYTDQVLKVALLQIQVVFNSSHIAAYIFLILQYG